MCANVFPIYYKPFKHFVILSELSLKCGEIVKKIKRKGLFNFRFEVVAEQMDKLCYELLGAH